MRTAIEFLATMCVDHCGEEMFDFNTSSLEEKNKFKSLSITLPPPSEDSRVYYFIHKTISNFDDDFIHIEHRKEFKSSNDSSSVKGTFDPSKFMLVAGVEFFYKANKKGEKQLMMKCYKARDIPTNIFYMETKETALPYWVVRSFGKRGLALYKWQILKLGRSEFEISQVQAQPNHEEYYASLKEEEILHLQPLSLLKAESSYLVTDPPPPAELPQCRICYNSDDTEEDRLITPCKCQSSIGSVHVECFRRWMKYRVSKMKSEAGQGGAFHTHLMTCEICKAKVPKVIQNGQRRYPLLTFFEDFKPYLTVLPIVNTHRGDPVYITVDDENATTIGRLPENGVVLNEITVSRKHSLITLDKHKRFVIVDSQSKFGTLVYDEDAEVKISKNLKAFQVRNTVFTFALKEIEEKVQANQRRT